MPEYRKADVNRLVKREEVERMLKVIPELRDRALIVFLYLFGPRPSEVLEMKVEDVTIEPTKIIVKIPTKKIERKDGKKKFKLLWRMLAVRRPHPRDWVIEELVRYVEIMKRGAPDSRLFPISRRTLNWIVEKWSLKALGEVLAPYNFRHTRLTMLSRAGATVDELMHWKGALDVRSVSPYLHGRPMEIVETEKGEVKLIEVERSQMGEGINNEEAGGKGEGFVK